jgi:hypothetical protein
VRPHGRSVGWRLKNSGWAKMRDRPGRGCVLWSSAGEWLRTLLLVWIQGWRLVGQCGVVWLLWRWLQGRSMRAGRRRRACNIVPKDLCYVRVNPSGRNRTTHCLNWRQRRPLHVARLIRRGILSSDIATVPSQLSWAIRHACKTEFHCRRPIRKIGIGRALAAVATARGVGRW